METLREEVIAEFREQQKASEDRIIAQIKGVKSAKHASRMSDSDYRSLCISGYPSNDQFWSKIEKRVSIELLDLLKPVVERFTAKALELLLLKATAEVQYVQPLGRAMIVELVDLANQHLESEFAIESEVQFETFMHMHGESCSVKGKYDSIIRDVITHVHVMSWEFKKLDANLTDSNIAQLAATMAHGINVSRQMTKLPKRAVGFLTSLDKWIMVTATLTGGEYKWATTPPFATIADAAVDVGACGHVAKLLCFAFANAKSQQVDAAAAALRELASPDSSGPDGESGANPPDDDPNDYDDPNDGTDTAPRSHGGVSSGKDGPVLRSGSQRRPLGNVDSNCTAPLSIRNVEKYGSMTRSPMPLDRFITAPNF